MFISISIQLRKTLHSVGKLKITSIQYVHFCFICRKIKDLLPLSLRTFITKQTPRFKELLDHFIILANGIMKVVAR